MERKGIVIMGSTGSIGRQTVDVVSRYPELFRVCALTARRNWQLLAGQALRLRPEMVVIADSDYLPPLREALASTDIIVRGGGEALLEAASLPSCSLVVAALVGYSGLPSTVAALESGKDLALANKETLVVAGELIMRLSRENGCRILPVDSEHSAIFQCLLGEDRKRSLRKIILTASGGPFRTFSAEQMKGVTLEQTLAHPNWDMGAKVTVDSATMMNKGFEMMEARWLFDCPPRDIEVVVHPQSVVHSMVEFRDGSVKAQLGMPDMRIPIGVALGFPSRLDLVERGAAKSLGIADFSNLTFEKPDYERFPLLRLAYRVIEEGGLTPAVLNAANEVAVKAFLDRRLPFCAIAPLVEKMVARACTIAGDADVNLENIEEVNGEAVEMARSLAASKHF